MNKDKTKNPKEIDETVNNGKTVIDGFSVPDNEEEPLSEDVKQQLNNLAGDINNIEATDANNEEIIEEEVIKDKLEKVASATTPKKKQKNAITSLILLVVNIILVYSLASNLIKGSEDATLSHLISAQGVRLNYLWWCLAMFILVILADTLLIAVILKTTTKKFRFGLAYKASSLGKYYEGITPFNVGGQPAQIVCLTKNKVSPGVATSVPIIRVVLINFVTVLLSVFLFMVHIPNITGGNGLINILIGILEILAYVGIIINALFFVAIFIIANSKVVGRSLARGMVKVGYKLKIFKNYRTAYKKIINQVTEYRNSIDYLKKHALTLVLSVLLVIIEIIALASIPFFVTIGITNITFLTTSELFDFWVECLIKYYICYYASTYIPLPGGTGMMEIAFVILFSSIIGPNFVAWGFLIWRFASYYSIIVQGFIITIIDVIRGLFKGKTKLEKKGG